MRTIALILVLTTTFGLCRAKEIREDWIKNDSIFINLLKKEYLSNPTSIEKYLEPWEKKRENLGYGYYNTPNNSDHRVSLIKND